MGIFGTTPLLQVVLDDSTSTALLSLSLLPILHTSYIVFKLLAVGSLFYPHEPILHFC